MQFEHKNNTTQPETPTTLRYRRWLAAIAMGAVGVAGGVGLEKASGAQDYYEPVLSQEQSDDGELVTTDQEGNRWSAISVPEGGTISARLGGDQEAIQRVLHANGIEDARDVRPEQPIWVPEAALEEDRS